MARPRRHRCCGVCVQFFGIHASWLAYRYRKDVWNQRGYDGHVGFGICVGGNASFRAIDDYRNAPGLSQASLGGYRGVPGWAGSYVVVDKLLDAHGGAHGSRLRAFGILGYCRAYCGAFVAAIVGLPLGRAIGLAVGWRLTFAIVAVISALLLVYLLITLPWVPGAEPFSIGQLPGLFQNKGLVALFVLTALYAWGYYTGYSYIEPFLLQVAGLENDVVTLVLSVFGVASIIGSILCSKLYPRFRFPFFRAITIGVPVALLLMHAAAGLGLAAILGVVVLWGISAASVSVVYQAEIINVSSDEEETVAMAFFSGIFNFGIGTGALLGGQVVNTLGIASVFYAGGIIGMVSILFCLVVAVGRLKRYSVK